MVRTVSDPNTLLRYFSRRASHKAIAAPIVAPKTQLHANHQASHTPMLRTVQRLQQSIRRHLQRLLLGRDGLRLHQQRLLLGLYALRLHLLHLLLGLLNLQHST
jgi:hypothetical protein